jgi:hypothetical protein
MRKILINTTNLDIEIHDTGVVIAADSSYELVCQDWDLWSASRDIIEFIVSDRLVINDGEDDLPHRYAIGLIQDNQVVMDEYYTLVQGDDVLVGNGEILYLNDEMWSTDNVPFEMDQQLEEDDGTY